MSEEKIVKHTENALHLLQDKEKGWKRKIKEFAEEIIIIVFAVTLTLMFHNWNDRMHERKIEREFLIGIKTDLDTGAAHLEKGVHQFQATVDYYNTVWDQLRSNKIDAGYIDSNSQQLFNTLYLSFDDGRFEGFKFSGYLRLIENQKLLKHMMSLYTVAIPFEIDADKNVFRTREQDYNTYIGIKDVTDLHDPRITHVSRLVNDPAFRYQVARYTRVFAERQAHKLALAEKMKAVADEIGKELDK